MTNSTADASDGTAFGRGLFGRLRSAASADWTAYIDHAFVRQLAAGTLPEDAFRHYLVQDYLFLIQFARAWALAGVKADTLAELRAAARSMHGIIDTEMRLHVEFCAGWALSEADMENQPEAGATLAYTRYVLERGLTGDLLDLQVALAPCIVGYAEIGARLVAAGAATGANPYRAWIEMYGGAEYQDVARQAMAALDDSGSRRGADARFARLARTFTDASRLETQFWQMALDRAL